MKARSVTAGSGLAPIAVIPAGGKGVRFANIPAAADKPARHPAAKQAIRVAGHSLLEWSLRAVVRGGQCRRALVALPTDSRAEDFEVDAEFVGCPVNYCQGGASRAESVLNALCDLADEPEDSWVLVHDAVRPLLPPADVERLKQAVIADTARDGGILAVPVVDALKRGQGCKVASQLDRRDLWLAQTPQMFRLQPLRQALERASQLSDIGDEAEAMAADGFSVLLVVGDPINRKVTWSSDLEWVKGQLHAQERCS